MTRARKTTLAQEQIGCVQHDCAICKAQARKAKQDAAKEANANAFPQGSHSNGITKREYFAALALQGMLASDPIADRTKVNKAVWAKVAYEFADAMLAK